jgi:hypothetical protein
MACSAAPTGCHRAHPALNFCNYIGTTKVIPAWVDKETPATR